MADNVLDFNLARASKQGTSTKTSSKPASVNRIRTNQDVFEETYEDVMHSWNQHAAKNKLSEFIESKIPSFARGADHADYLNDLNVVVNAEQKLGMMVTMCYPGVTTSNADSWLVGFHRGKEVFSSTPPNMSEANARALNILLYLAFEFKMKKLKR